MGKVRKATALLIAAIFIFVFTSLFKEFISNYIVRYNLDSIEVPGVGSRVLVFSPHNDDEVLGSGELIKKSVKNGAEVKVVLVTNGDGYKKAIEFDYFNLNPKAQDYIRFGYMRQRESVKALEILGLSEKDIIFLGYPDGGISYLWSLHWDTDAPYTSNYTQTYKTPYSNSFTKDAAYTGQSLISDITKIIKEYNPTHIVFPHPNDRHPDHWAVNAFVKYALMLLDYSPKSEWLYLVHRGDWPTPMKKNSSMYLVPPAKLINIGTNWHALDMNAEDINEKSLAIHSYKTQIRTIGLLMSAFERKNELLGEYPNSKIIKYKNTDRDIMPGNENRIISDPLQDELKLQISKESDISGLYAEISNEDKLHIFLESAGIIDKFAIYNINTIMFDGSKVSRLNLAVEDGSLSAVTISRQSITNIRDIKLDVKGRYIHIIIPHYIAGNFTHLFINARTSIKDHMLDKTAWRMIDW